MEVPPEYLEQATRIFNETIEDHILSSEPELEKGEQSGQSYKPFTLLKHTLVEIDNKSQFLGWIFLALYAKEYQTASPDGPTAQIIETLHELEEGKDFKQAFMALAKQLYDSFFFLIMAKFGKTPASSCADSLSPLNADQEATNSRKESVRTQCLERDSYKCVISGTCDRDRVITEYKNRENEIPQGLQTSNLRVAYIFPSSLGQQSTDTYLLSIKTLTKSILGYFDSAITVLLNNNKTDSPMNAISLTPILQEAFDDFEIYFQSTGRKDEYEVKVWKRPYPQGLMSSNTIIFADGANSSIDLPSKKLLNLHRAIGQILHLSGAGESIRKLLEQSYNLDTVAEDGSTPLGDIVTLLLLKGR